MPLQTPVVLVIFNRPELTETVFSAIAKVKPEKLMVVADGPRFAQEAEACEQTRAIIEAVDWDCKVQTDFSEKNLGAGRRIGSGLDWVFSEVEEAIILEDDCLPTPSFFHFCQTLLEYYRHDERVMQISGSNYQLGHKRGDYSYYFSKYPHSGGWASWQRAWKHFDHDIKTWPESKETQMIEALCTDPHEQKYWTQIFDRMFENAPVSDVWDYQWTYACWRQNGLAIVPNVNLISNLGWGRPDATHTSGKSHLAQLPTGDIWEIRHPPRVVRHRDADAYTFDYSFEGKRMKMRGTMLGRLIGVITKMILPAKARRWLRIQEQRLIWQQASRRTRNERTRAIHTRS
jgi:hypothetical protein